MESSGSRLREGSVGVTVLGAVEGWSQGCGRREGQSFSDSHKAKGRRQLGDQALLACLASTCVTSRSHFQFLAFCFLFFDTCLRVHLCMCAWRSACLCRGQNSTLPQLLPTLSFMCFCFPRSRVTVTMSGTYVGAGDLNLGLHAWTAF